MTFSHLSHTLADSNSLPVDVARAPLPTLQSPNDYTPPPRPSLFWGGGGGALPTVTKTSKIKMKLVIQFNRSSQAKSTPADREYSQSVARARLWRHTFSARTTQLFSPLLCSARDRLQMGQCRRNCGRRTGESVSLHTGAIFHICFCVYVPVTLYDWKRQFWWKRSFTHLYSLRYSILRLSICVCIFKLPLLSPWTLCELYRCSSRRQSFNHAN